MTDGYEIARITITRTIDEDGDDIVDYDLEGVAAEHVVLALGMLAMTQDSILHPDDD